MKQILFVLTLVVGSGTFASASPSQASFRPVRATHERVQHHRTHKAGECG